MPSLLDTSFGCWIILPSILCAGKRLLTEHDVGRVTRGDGLRRVPALDGRGGYKSGGTADSIHNMRSGRGWSGDGEWLKNIRAGERRDREMKIVL
jgi:hypothetical protein